MNQYTPLDVDRIEDARKDGRIGSKVVLYKSTASTNDIAWEYAANAGNDGLCVLAESQHKGRGRRGRVWFSEPGQSILCSVLLTKTAAAAEMLTLTAGVAVAEAIIDTCKVSCRIKWPNDILIRNQKVAGILTEKQTSNGRDTFVVGIGINCHQTPAEFAGYDLKIPATSLALETGREIDRTEFVCELLKQIEKWLDKARVGSTGSAGNPVIERWLQLSGMLGRPLTVECDGVRYSGFCRGVDPVDGLILQLDNSLVRMFTAAQTSIIES
jgi:BirA family biotin operon repressor/biotin-[acetyl-CoA-carboxylase] ligase